jgi:hypothetical protein
MRLKDIVRRFAEMAKQTEAPSRDAKPAEPEAAPIAAPPVGELGLSGTSNWNGRIHVEANTKLQWERAFGTPGATDWGEWEKLERTDHQVASALNLLAAPIRDAEVEIALPKEHAEALKAKAREPGPEIADEAEPEEKEFADEVAGSPSESARPDGTPEQRDPAQDAEGEPAADPMVQEAEQMQKIADFVRDNLTEWLDPGWPQLLEQMVRYGLGYGFSLHEVVWDTRDDERVPGGKAFYVKKLAQRLPSSVKSNGWIEKNGELVAVKQSGVKDGKWYEAIELPADKCLLATWNRSGNNYQGFSAFRPGWYMGQIRAELLKIIAIGHQRESLGVPVAEVDKDVPLTEEQREALQTLLENSVYHENAAIQLPPGVKMQWVFSPGANKSHVVETWRALGLSMLELVQAQQQALGTGDTGSRAVGEVHDATKNAFIQGVRAWIEAVFNGTGSQPYTGLVRKIIDLNFGPQKVYPKFELRLKKAESDTESTRQLQFEVFISEYLGLPPIDPNERAAMKEKEAADKAKQLEAMKQNAAPEGADPKVAKAFSDLFESLSDE